MMVHFLFEEPVNQIFLFRASKNYIVRRTSEDQVSKMLQSVLKLITKFKFIVLTNSTSRVCFILGYRGRQKPTEQCKLIITLLYMRQTALQKCINLSPTSDPVLVNFVDREVKYRKLTILIYVSIGHEILLLMPWKLLNTLVSKFER